MQGLTYSIFSILAVAIHLIFNSRMLLGRGLTTKHGACYRGFLFGILAYYIADGAWGVFAELGWMKAWYVDTVLFFLSLVAFVVMWCRFVIAYLHFGKWTARVLSIAGCALIAFNIAALAANFFCDCFFHFDADGVYQIDYLRDPAFFFLVAYDVVVACFVLANAIRNQDAVRRRSLMVFMFSVVIALFIVLQVIWPLTPFTALGCLIGNCFFHVFVVQDEQSIKHMNQLEKALARARAAEKARSMFFSIVSHDIRTPLNAILGYSELLQHGIKTKRERDEALKSIRASGTTLLQLVNDVLDLAKMDAGKLALNPQCVQLAHLTDEVFASFRLAAEKKGVSLVNKVESVPPLLLDSHRFRQILFNLVGNAVKFTSRGSITVSANYAESRLKVAVTDTGCGIPSDMLARVLDPFVQIHDASHASDRAGGSGLGLSICRRLVEIMGGELVVESELGKGSSFKICLPGVAPADEAPSAVETPKNASVPDGLPSRVLVIDDSPVNRLVLTAFLKKAGISAIDQAGDGEEALAALDEADKSKRPYELVFSDYWMPNMNGFEFIEKVRADSRFAHLSIFAVTADTEYKSDERAGLFTGILMKPLTYAKLLEVLASLPS